MLRTQILSTPITSDFESTSEIKLFCHILLIFHHHHHISVTQLGYLLTRSGLTYPEVSSKVYHDPFCQSDSRVSLPWVIYFEAFYLHVLPSFSCIPVICHHYYHHHHHHHHISVMELGHLLTRYGLTYPEVSSKVYHDSLFKSSYLFYIHVVV